MKTDDNTNYLLVRSSRSIPVEDGYVGIGWGEIPFKDIADPEEIIQEIKNKHGGIGRKSNHIRRFKSIKKGDIIIVPFWGTILIGRATGKEHYDAAYMSSHGANQQQVDFQKNDKGEVFSIPRINFSGSFQNRLRIRTTIADMRAFKKEIDKVLSKLHSNEMYSWSNERVEESSKLEKEFKSKLLGNIQTGKTNLQSGGCGLEELVEELLSIEGYQAAIQPKKKFPGTSDADIIASKTDQFSETKLLIQVKHHSGETGLWGQQQLLGIKEILADEYREYKLVLVTCGEISEEGNSFAEENDVSIIDGNQLADWIYDSIPKLSNKTKLTLGISEIPRMNL